MPVLPQAINIDRKAANPTTAVAQYNPGAVEEAVGNLGQSVTRAANIASDVQHRLARLHAQDAIVELKRAQNDLTFGQDGYARLQNGAAAAPGVYKKYEDLHRTTRDLKGAKLDPLAKQYYEREAKEMGDHFQAGFLRHAMTEEINHRGAVYKANVAVSAETAALNYNNPEVLANEKTARNRMLAQHFHDQGLMGDDDKNTREFMSQQAHGEAHEAVIRAYLNNDQVKDADAYLKANRQEMTQERAQAVQNLMKNELAADDGRDIATHMYNMKIKGASELEIQKEKMRLTQGKSVTATNFADNMYGDLVKAQATDERRAMGSILLGAMSGGAGTGLNDPRMKELELNNPELAARVRKSLQVQAGKAPGGKVKYSDMTVFANLADKIQAGEDLTAEDIVGESQGVLTPADVKLLINKVGSRDSAVGKFKLPNELVNASIPDSAVKNVQNRHEYKGHVAQKFQEWQEANPKKIPTPDEQKAIVRSASEEYVVVRDWWADTTKEAYKLEGTEAKLYPKRYITQLPKYTEDQRIAAYAAYQASIRNRQKGDVPLSEAEFLVRWDKTLEAAKQEAQK